MTSFDEDEYKNLSKQDKVKVCDKKILDSIVSEEDAQLRMDLIQIYKASLEAEKAKHI